MDIGGRLLAAGHVEIAPTRRAGADENRIVAFVQDRLEAVDALVAEGDTEIEHIADLLVDHRFRQAEFRDLRAHEAAGLRVLIEDRHLIAERGKIARHRQRRRAGADTGDALTVLLTRLGHQPAHIALIIGGDALEPADGNRLFLDTAAAAGRFTGPVAGTS